MAARWHTITDKPDRPIGVELFYGKLKPLNQHGDECPSVMGVRDFRRELGFFRDGCFFEMGSGHSVFEPWRGEEEMPTHWRELPALPEGF